MAAVCARMGCHQLAGTCNPSKRPGWGASVTQSRNGSLCSLRPFCPSVPALSAASIKQLGSGSAARCDASESTRRPKYVPNKIHHPDYVTISDTTLRDGEQSPGATMTSKENSKLDIARQLAKLGVDIIEAGLGFPVASPDDLEAVRNINGTGCGQQREIQ